jgi:hypothetical protein
VRHPNPCPPTHLPAISSHISLRGTSLIRSNPPPLGSLEGPRQRTTVGSQGGAVSYERGTPVPTISSLTPLPNAPISGLSSELYPLLQS